MADTEARWYVAHTYSGYENKVKADIENTNIDVNDIDRENIIKKTIEYSSISVGEDYIYTSIFFLLGGIPLCFMYKILCMLSDISSDNDVAIDENRAKDKYGMFNINFAYCINMIPSIFAFLSYTIADFLFGYDIKKVFYFVLPSRRLTWRSRVVQGERNTK